MAKIQTKTVKLSEIHLNPDNPRTITGKAMANLTKSLKEFPEMLELREIVVDESMMVLGGNMRLRALQESGTVECVAKIVTGLTDDQKREFVIKDNAGFGEWDMDALANAWDDLPLADWGIGLPEDWGAEKEQIDLSDSVNETFEVVVSCVSEIDQEEVYNRLSGEGLTCRVLTL